jgi:hypothetical protein
MTGKQLSTIWAEGYQDLFHPVDKANSINNYFTSVSNIDSEPYLPDVPPLAPCELSGIVINEQEVYDQFQILNIVTDISL